MTIGTRRRSRELAMQALFFLGKGQEPVEEGLELFCRCFHPSKKALPFFRKLVLGVLDHLGPIDRIIEKHSAHWKIFRMPGVDRNILRIAVFELLFCSDIPDKVSINEAIDIGKKFGSEDSGAFINGILDSIRIAINAGEIDTETEPEPIFNQKKGVIDGN